MDINKEDKDGWTPLFNACLDGHITIVKYLVELGADINKQSNDGHSPLYNAFQNEHENFCKIFN